MLVVPGAIAGLILLHLYRVIRLGVASPPWSKGAPDRPWSSSIVCTGIVSSGASAWIAPSSRRRRARA